MEKFNQIITAILSSKVSIVIYIAMFIYLVPVPLIAFIPGMEWLMPSTAAMLVGDNYTSVLAALGASIASLAGVKIHQSQKEYHKKHDQLQKSLDDLHAKVDKLSK
jgi:phosphoglycolate phosphatase-like HAD superfamily hydrolase